MGGLTVVIAIEEEGGCGEDREADAEEGGDGERELAAVELHAAQGRDGESAPIEEHTRLRRLPGRATSPRE